MFIDMKIGIESQRIFRAAKHGMDVVALEQMRCLQQTDSGNEYILFAARGPDRGCISDTASFQTRLLSGFTYADWEQLSLPRAVKKIRPDLLHCTGNTAPLNCQVPLVLTLHDIIYLEEVSFRGSAYQNFGNLYRRMIVPRVMRNASRIVTVSEFEKKVITDNCAIDPSKLQVIYNGVASVFHPRYEKEALAKFRAGRRLPSDFILVLGNRSPKKNTAGMIKAYVHYCNISPDPVPLVVADYGAKGVGQILRSMGRMDLFPHFIFTGYVPPAEMPLLYNCSSLFIYPSLRESFGMPVLEAMACGVPVITSNVSAIPEIAGDAALLTDPASPASISEAIQQILSDNALREEYVAKGLVRASHFSWKNSAMQLLEVYRSAV